MFSRLGSTICLIFQNCFKLDLFLMVPTHLFFGRLCVCVCVCVSSLPFARRLAFGVRLLFSHGAGRRGPWLPAVSVTFWWLFPSSPWPRCLLFLSVRCAQLCCVHLVVFCLLLLVCSSCLPVCLSVLSFLLLSLLVHTHYIHALAPLLDVNLSCRGYEHMALDSQLASPTFWISTGQMVLVDAPNHCIPVRPIDHVVDVLLLNPFLLYLLSNISDFSISKSLKLLPEYFRRWRDRRSWYNF